MTARCSGKQCATCSRSSACRACRRRKRTAGARARFARAERAAVLQESLTGGADLYEVQPGDELLFRRAGVPETVLRRLRRGTYRVESEIDLHGLTVSQATAQLNDFLREARAHGCAACA